MSLERKSLNIGDIVESSTYKGKTTKITGVYKTMKSYLYTSTCLNCGKEIEEKRSLHEILNHLYCPNCKSNILKVGDKVKCKNDKEVMITGVFLSYTNENGIYYGNCYTAPCWNCGKEDNKPKPLKSIINNRCSFCNKNSQKPTEENKFIINDDGKKVFITGSKHTEKDGKTLIKYTIKCPNCGKDDGKLRDITRIKQLKKCSLCLYDYILKKGDIIINNYDKEVSITSDGKSVTVGRNNKKYVIKYTIKCPNCGKDDGKFRDLISIKKLKECSLCHRKPLEKGDFVINNYGQKVEILEFIKDENRYLYKIKCPNCGKEAPTAVTLNRIKQLKYCRLCCKNYMEKYSIGDKVKCKNDKEAIITGIFHEKGGTTYTCKCPNCGKDDGEKRIASILEKMSFCNLCNKYKVKCRYTDFKEGDKIECDNGKSSTIIKIFYKEVKEKNRIGRKKQYVINTCPNCGEIMTLPRVISSVRALKGCEFCSNFNLEKYCSRELDKFFIIKKTANNRFNEKNPFFLVKDLLNNEIKEMTKFDIIKEILINNNSLRQLFTIKN